jgi:hypothetical protein
MVTHITVGNLVIALLAFAVLTFEGCRQLYRAKHVDRLESEGKITPESAARIRKKPIRMGIDRSRHCLRRQDALRYLSLPAGESIANSPAF